MKDYSEQKYRVSITVRIVWADGMVHVDEIKGLNIGHALYLACLNWFDAKSVERVI
jgi:hypothetical protein